MKSSWVILGPQAKDWCPCKRKEGESGQKDTQRKRHMKMGAELRVRQPHAKEHLSTWGSGRGRILP